jgi:hypothetical protein
MVQAFGAGPALTTRIADLEHRLKNTPRDDAVAMLASDGVTEAVVTAAMTIKQLSAQIDVVIHAVGILISLPYILEPKEVIESLSLGAGSDKVLPARGCPSRRPEYVPTGQMRRTCAQIVRREQPDVAQSG